jgi:hypothetical protein
MHLARIALLIAPHLYPCGVLELCILLAILFATGDDPALGCPVSTGHRHDIVAIVSVAAVPLRSLHVQ